MLDIHAVRLDCSRALFSAGRMIAMRMAMIPITTRSSTSVKALRFFMVRSCLRIALPMSSQSLCHRERNLTVLFVAPAPDHPTGAALALALKLHVLWMFITDAHQTAHFICRVDV